MKFFYHTKSYFNIWGFKNCNKVAIVFNMIAWIINPWKHWNSAATIEGFANAFGCFFWLPISGNFSFAKARCLFGALVLAACIFLKYFFSAEFQCHSHSATRCFDESSAFNDHKSEFTSGLRHPVMARLKIPKTFRHPQLLMQLWRKSACSPALYNSES